MLTGLNASVGSRQNISMKLIELFCREFDFFSNKILAAMTLLLLKNKQL
jgi:hypothetical protein